MALQIVSVNTARPTAVRHQDKEIETGIFKAPVQETLRLSALNLDGDEQADKINHGGPDKAVCFYPHEHYAYWSGRLKRTLPPGAFGENVTLLGLPETEACVGDVVRWGDAVLQIAQPRMPCYKVAVKWGDEGLPQAMMDTGYTGYYARVLAEGEVGIGREAVLLERDPHGLTIAEINRVLYRDRNDAEALRAMIEIPAIAERLRATLRKRLNEAQDAK